MRDFEDISLDVVALTKIDGDFIKNTLLNNITEKILINCYSVEEGLEDINPSPVVLVSGPFLQERVKSLFPHSKIIVAKRTITGQNLEKLMVLPKGKKVLVINYPEEVTEETIISLKSLGLTHLEYIPYSGAGIDLKDVDTAVSPGHIYLCPDFIPNKIDLSRRTLAFSTFVEVLLALGLSLKNLNAFGGHYTRLMVNAGRKVAKLLRDTESLSKNLEIVLDKIREGIVTVDQDGLIKVFTPLAEKIFGLHAEDVLGKSYQEVFSKYPDVSRTVASQQDVSEVLFNIEGKKIIGNFTCIETYGEKSIICSFVEVLNIQRLEETVRRQLNKKGYVAKYTFADITGNSTAIRQAKDKAQRFAANDLTILLTGESGTGKELFAQAIHNASRRAEGPFIAVNFAALPETLVESELFGYEEGAFTGALKGGKAGLFEQAHRGTIFLDEIGDAPMAIQSRLLRVLQEKEVMRLGATKIIPVDVRVIAATNKNLAKLVQEGKFREDLYYRLKVLPLAIPPLRERKEDIPLLIEKMMLQAKISKKISPLAMDYILRYDWPGNVRELLNIATYLISVSAGDVIHPEDLPPDLVACHSTEEINDTKVLLEKTGYLKDCLYILQALKEAKALGKAAGRKTITHMLQKKGICLTEEQIRMRLRKMEQAALVSCGVTRQGCHITEKGMELLRQNKGI